MTQAPSAPDLVGSPSQNELAGGPPDKAQMIGPGQEELAERLMEEIETEEAEQALKEWNEIAPQVDEALRGQEESPEALLAGKFKSTEELEKAYLETQQEASLPQPAPEQYTPEMGKQLYGDAVSGAFEAAGVNPLEMAQKVYGGQDVRGYVDALVERGGLPRPLVETYLQGVSSSGAEPANPGLSDADIVEIMGTIGGEQQFKQLSSWAKTNLSQQELVDYNAAIDSGNKGAARFAVGQLQARASASGQEPKLIGGGSAAATNVFETPQQVLEAQRRLDKNGRLQMDTDPKYRRWFEQTLSRSSVFG